MLVLCFFFFFSSRRRHTRYIGDWSSDVCSSDLWAEAPVAKAASRARTRGLANAERRIVGSPESDSCGNGLHRAKVNLAGALVIPGVDEFHRTIHQRSEERRVGKEWRSGRSREH